MVMPIGMRSPSRCAATGWITPAREMIIVSVPGTSQCASRRFVTALPPGPAAAADGTSDAGGALCLTEAHPAVRATIGSRVLARQNRRMDGPGRRLEGARCHVRRRREIDDGAVAAVIIHAQTFPTLLTTVSFVLASRRHPS